MATDEEAHFTYPYKIESISDILDIINRPNEYLADILDVDADDPHYPAPMGRHHQGTPRPYPHGIWFRGQSKSKRSAVPSVFRKEARQGSRQFLDERELFTDVRLRSSNGDLRGLNNLELMWLMQHHSLPTRLLDWSESPLVASFFATASQFNTSKSYTERVAANHTLPTEKRQSLMDVPDDCALYVLNAYRLNTLTNLSMRPDANNIFQQQDMDVVLRSIMAEHTYIDSVVAKIRTLDYVTEDKNSEAIREYLGNLAKELEQRGTQKDLRSELPTPLAQFHARLSAPVAVIPRRNHPRMDAQLSCFTIHGGKVLYGDVIDDVEKKDTSNRGKERNNWNFLPEPSHLFHINSEEYSNKLLGAKEFKPFLIKFVISRYAVNRIMIELDRLGISEAMIYQDMENQSNFAKRRWATIQDDRPIWSLPALEKSLSTYTKNDNTNSGRIESNKENYMKNIYGMEE